jgi:hypothetical protein
MKRYRNKKTIIIASLFLLFSVVIDTTLAYVLTNTNPAENTFTPSHVSCAVVENGGKPVSGSLINTGASKDNVRIKNTGDTAAYIRVAIVVNWARADGAGVWVQKPVESKDGINGDYTITYNISAGGWFDGRDGFYYYSKAVSPDDLTGILISNASLLSNATPPTGTDGTQYYLSIEIVASAIQSTPASPVSDQWGVTVSDEGTISK